MPLTVAAATTRKKHQRQPVHDRAVQADRVDDEQLGVDQPEHHRHAAGGGGEPARNARSAPGAATPTAGRARPSPTKYASPSTATGIPRKCDCAEVVTLAQLMSPLSEQARLRTSV